MKPPTPQFLYDLVFEKEDPGFKGASRTHRDTKNPTHLTTDRALGGQTTSQRLSYPAPEEFAKPEHARRPLVRDTFYRWVWGKRYWLAGVWGVGGCRTPRRRSLPSPSTRGGRSCGTPSTGGCGA
jgi:hypothetical protein